MLRRAATFQYLTDGGTLGQQAVAGTNKPLLCYLTLRTQTDLIGMVLIPLTLVVLSIMSIYCWANQNLEALLAPSDSYGNLCGIGPLLKRPYLYKLNVTCFESEECRSKTVCVKRCPTSSLEIKDILSYSNKYSMDNIYQLNCEYAYYTNFTRGSLENGEYKKYCAAYMPPTVEIERICVPTEIAQDTYKKLTYLEFIQKEYAMSNNLVCMFRTMHEHFGLIMYIIMCGLLVSLLWCSLIFFLPGIGVVITAIVFLLILPIYMVSVMESVRSKTMISSIKNVRYAFIVCYLVVFTIEWLIFIFHAYQVNVVIEFIKETMRLVNKYYQLLLTLALSMLLHLMLFYIIVKLSIGICSVYVLHVTWYHTLNLKSEFTGGTALFFTSMYLFSVLTMFFQVVVNFFVAQVYWNKAHISIFSTMGCILKYHLGSVMLGAVFTAILRPLHMLGRFSTYESFSIFTKFSKDSFIIMGIYGGDYETSNGYLYDLTIFNRHRVLNFCVMLDQTLLYVRLTITTIIGYKIMETFEMHSYNGALISAVCTLMAFLISGVCTSYFEAVINTAYVCIFESIDEDRYKEPGYQQMGGGVQNVLLLPTIRVEITHRNLTGFSIFVH